jgi:hypothetical protein
MYIILMIVLFILGIVLGVIGAESYEHDGIFIGIGFTSIIISVIMLIVGLFHGFIDYKESNDKDLARIVAVTQEQDLLKAYFKVEVEYLTNTPTQDGVLQKKDIEKDTFYCYYEDQELVKQLQDNLYKEVWIITGYKGGYDSAWDFGNHLIKRIELKEE